MLKITAVLWIACCCFTQAAAQILADTSKKVRSSNALSTPLDRKVDSVLMPFMRKARTAGMAAGIVDNGKLYEYYYGETSRGNQQLPTTNTLFEIGSVSKTFTSTLLASFIEQGLVKANDPVSKYLPETIPVLAYNSKPITLVMLANHTSGLPRLPLDLMVDAPANNPYVRYDSIKLYSWLKGFKPYREPGQTYEYSNLAVGLLGVILERISHKSYEQLVQQYITGPLKMKATKITLQAKDSSLFAQGHDAVGNPVHSWEFQALAGAGAIRSTLNDMLLYASAQATANNKDPLGKAIVMTHQPTFANDKVKLGMAWHIFPVANNQYLLHDGQTAGFRSIVVFNAATNKAVVILTNASVDPSILSFTLLSWLDKQ